MPLDRPTLDELEDRILGDIDSKLPGIDPRLEEEPLGILAEVVAASSHETLGSLDSVVRDQFPDTASDTALRRWGRVHGTEEQATGYASGTATTTGDNGKSIPSGTLLQNGLGFEYQTTTTEVIAGGVATLQLEAVLIGTAGNAVEASLVSYVSPIVGVDTDATVDAGGLTGGVDVEATEDYRVRVRADMSRPAQGGNANDWDRWMRDYSALTITRWWVTRPPPGMDVVTVSFVIDGQVPITPTGPQVTAVQTYLEGLACLGTTVLVAAPVLEPLGLQIALTPDTAAVRAAVEAEFEDLILREAVPGGTILLSHLREMISISAGETDHDLQDPVADATPAAPSNLFTDGNIVWV
jgi:uncharacterized phage protein gp47/JayE